MFFFERVEHLLPAPGHVLHEEIGLLDLGVAVRADEAAGYRAGEFDGGHDEPDAEVLLDHLFREELEAGAEIGDGLFEAEEALVPRHGFRRFPSEVKVLSATAQIASARRMRASTAPPSIHAALMRIDMGSSLLSEAA